MVVHVYRQSGQNRYAGISAIGVGHDRKDLVLVTEGGELIEIGPDQWLRFCVEQIEASAQPPPPVEADRGFRAITLVDD